MPMCLSACGGGGAAAAREGGIGLGGAGGTILCTHLVGRGLVQLDMVHISLHKLPSFATGSVFLCEAVVS
jgi:hypothetical protein